MSVSTVLCLPFAGAGAGFYRAWQPPAGALSVTAVQLAGREERFSEPAATSVAEAVQALVREAEELLSQARAAGGLAVFGHSMGAVLAFELVRTVEQTSPGSVRHLFVSGSPAPHRQRDQHASWLDDDAFAARVEEFAGYRHPAFDDPEMRELLLPLLRADVEMHESYHAADGARVSVPVTALRGCDDHLVDVADLRGWSRVADDLVIEELPGGHMYLADDQAALYEVLERNLQRDSHGAGPGVASSW